MEQIDRAQRYLERMRRIYAGIPAEWEHRRDFQDDVFSFFVHCHHIRDWIVALNKLGITSQLVDQYINDHLCLRICADLCNITKHCRITRRTRSGNSPHITGSRYEGDTRNDSDGERNFLKCSFTVFHDGKTLDALELAEQCMTAWTDYVQYLRHLAPLSS